MNVKPNTLEEHYNNNVNHDSLLLCFINNININNSNIYDEFISDAVDEMKENTSETLNIKLNKTKVILWANCNDK